MNHSNQIKWVFLAVLLLVIAAISTSMQVSNIQSAMRAFVDEESSWAKSHRDAFQSFIIYQHNHEPQHFDTFMQQLAFNRGIAETKKHLDLKQYKQAKEVLLRIGSNKYNTDKIIYLSKNFSWLKRTQEAFKIWDDANELLSHLEHLALAYRAAENLSIKKELLADIQTTRQGMLKAESDFENAFVNLAQQTDSVLSVLTAIIFSLLGSIVFSITKKALNKITEKDELYQATFNKSQLAYVQFKLNGDLIDANQQFLDLINCNHDIMKGLNFFKILRSQGNPAHLISVKSSSKHQNFQFKLGAENDQDKFYKAHTTLIHNYSGTPLYFVAAINDISQEKAKNKALRKLAHNDFLTGLMNKFAFEKLLAIAIQKQTNGYLLYMDLNGFKAVNDQAGHQVGDRILEQVTAKIRGQLRKDDPLARMGGDEFALFLADVSIERATEVANNIRLALSKNQFTHELNHFDISISVGISGLAEKPKSLHDLINQADEACYQSKTTNKVVVHQSMAQSA